MKYCMSGAALFFNKIENKFPGLCLTYVSDTLHAGDSKYALLTNLTKAKFILLRKEWNNTQCYGVLYKQTDFGFKLQQTSYKEKVKEKS